MATPPFNPDETKPAAGDLISQYPSVEQTARDVFESWLLAFADRNGDLSLQDRTGSTPAGTAGRVTVWQEGGVPKFRDGTGTVKDFLDQVAADARYVELAGDTMTGNLAISKQAPSLNFIDTEDGTGTIAQDGGFITIRPATATPKVRFSGQSDQDIAQFLLRRGGAFVEVYDRSAIATQAQAEAGTDNDKVMTPLRVKQSIDANAPFSSSFTSSELTVGNGGAVSAAHGLGGIPTIAQLSLRCKTAELGYSVGDEVRDIANYGGDGSQGANLVADATNVTVVDVSDGPRIGDKSTGAEANITPANWRYVIRAWR